jgi:hypothetical protein
MNRVRYLLVILVFLIFHSYCSGQNDTIPSFIKGKPVTGTRVTDTLPHSDSIRARGHKESPYKVDSLGRRLHDPRRATIRSAIIPGWGQIYNRKYWKLPLVYAAIGIPAYTYFYNKKWYQKCQYAVSVIDTYSIDTAPIPASVLAKVDPKLLPIVNLGDDNSLRTYRNEFRKDQDYSVLFFLLFWGLNVVDATVDAHLMYFDVSDKLSMRLDQPSPICQAPGKGSTGVSLVFDFHKARFKQVMMP